MVYRLVKQKVFPKPHEMHLNFEMSAETRTKSGTCIPILYNDDGMSPSTYYANPQHASFAKDTQGGCYPESKVYNISAKIQLSTTKAMAAEDATRALKVHIIPIHTSFLEDLTPTNDLTGESVESLLELTHETTDRQTYPIYNGTDLSGETVDVGSRQMGLTTNSNLEGITLDLQKIYDALSYYTNKGKLKSCIGGIMTRVIYPSHPGNKPGQYQFKIRLPSKSKAINPYTFLGFIIYIPEPGVESQYGVGSDFTAVDHVHVDFRCRFNEWNDSFNMERA